MGDALDERHRGHGACTAIAVRLTWISAAMLAGFLFMGFFATGLVRRGIKLEKVYLGAMADGNRPRSPRLTLFSGPSAATWLWPLLGVCFSLSNIAYSLVAQAFPPALSGRANTALNLLVFAGAFGLQWGFGILVDLLQATGWTVETALPRWHFCRCWAGRSLRVRLAGRFRSKRALKAGVRIPAGLPRGANVTLTAP